MGFIDNLKSSKYLQVRRDAKESEKIMKADQMEQVRIRGTLVRYCDEHLHTLNDSLTIQVVGDPDEVMDVIDSLTDMYSISQGKSGVPADKQASVFVFRLKQVDVFG